MGTPAAETTSNRAAVQATNDDASASKLCATLPAGLLFANFSFSFSIAKLTGEIAQRSRYCLSEQALIPRIFSCRPDEGRAPFLYVELDFKEVTSKKAAIIETCSPLRDKVGASASISREKGEVISDSYKLLHVDLRNIQKLNDVIAVAGMDPSLPTFIIAECVLIYLDPDSTRAIVGWASNTFSTAVFFLYEQIHPDDAFGQQMIRNLERAVAWDMLRVYSDFIDAHERRRIERLELFDEFEEWHMMQEHYCVAYAIKDAMGLFRDLGFPNQQQDTMSTASAALP
ncbi:hypothetical protein Tsubulata_002700 [Turnera subulata]|uniref:Leucine carboxyl methyltransferase 1 homolog n=1 Tax=Turnera subulata TaxID=218843 RepID=A0A9Q0GD18_9ROSI|nr:hypothetical protein Tsubulata_002700 [Turnera subulata]